jgi:hypothetical protein
MVPFGNKWLTKGDSKIHPVSSSGFLVTLVGIFSFFKKS